MKKRSVWIMALAAALLLTACTNQSAVQSESPSGSTQSPVPASSETLPTADNQESGITEVTLQNDQTAVDGKGLRFDGHTLTISDGGTYALSGELQGMVMVDAGKEDSVQIILRGVQIACESSAAIYVRQADNVTVTLAENSDNRLSTEGAFVAIDDNNIDGVLFSKDDLTLDGTGSLTISSAEGHGVVSKDDLILNSGTYSITAAGHGLSGKDDVVLTGGTVTVVSGKDGVKAENKDDATLGNLQITGGTWNITAGGDGISAGNRLQIDDGVFQIQAGGGSANAPQHVDSWAQTSEEDSVSTKGVKAGGELLLNGGTFTLDTADDALHSNADLTLTGGSYQISAGDDAVHADAALQISGGSLTILQSYEGIEGQTVAISGGEIRLRASDDGLNAAGGADESGFGGPFGRDSFGPGAGSNCDISISGGTIFINADGDGIDSNGSLHVSGGTVYVSGPTDGGNGALDYDGEAQITGGVLVAVGASQMAQNFGAMSTQCAALVQMGRNSAGTITVTDESGAVLITMEAEKEYECVLFSCPDMKIGGSYTVSAGSGSQTVTLTETVYGGMSGMGFGGHGGQGVPGGPGGQGIPGEPPRN